jgi:hypothetical protein
MRRGSLLASDKASKRRLRSLMSSRRLRTWCVCCNGSTELINVRSGHVFLRNALVRASDARGI